MKEENLRLNAIVNDLVHDLDVFAPASAYDPNVTEDDYSPLPPPTVSLGEELGHPV